VRQQAVILLLLANLPILAAQESQLHADFRGEAERFQQSCEGFSLKKFPGCAELLFTDHPLHIAVGSIAPQNGFGAGAALVGHWTPNELWRTSWDADAIASDNGSWRAGLYYKAIHTPIHKITPVTSDTPPPSHSNLQIQPSTVLNVYAQTLSLDQLFFYGLGPDSLEADGTVFSLKQTIVGTDAIVPITTRIPISLLGEVNGRFVDLSGNHHESSPSIEEVFTEASAPGLTSQPPVLQLGEGMRFEPEAFNDHLQFDYLAQFQEFLVPSNSRYSFRRLNLDLDHTIPLYKAAGSYGQVATNGPDECASAPGAKCPAISRNREGSIEFRFLLTESIASAGSTVPFYFQPTLGGSDINGNPWLSSYHDYRFRAPNSILFRESFEHSVWGPIGFLVSADEGKVALTRGDIGFDQMAHSFSIGLTLRAGGLPAISLAFAWGGPEGTHTIAAVNTSLLGGSSRPSQF
jgi:hypothetical protein